MFGHGWMRRDDQILFSTREKGNKWLLKAGSSSLGLFTCKVYASLGAFS